MNGKWFSIVTFSLLCAVSWAQTQVTIEAIQPGYVERYKNDAYIRDVTDSAWRNYIDGVNPKYKEWFTARVEEIKNIVLSNPTDVAVADITSLLWMYKYILFRF